MEEDSDLIPTYLNLTVTSDPFLELPAENDYDYYAGSESTNLLMAGTMWAKKFEKNKRVVKVFGEDVEGKSIFLCRYIRPQKLPESLFDAKRSNADEDFKYAIQNAARFVSLIPFLDDNAAFDNKLPDLWCTSQEFLDLGYGDYEEHAILLCNYFNYIDQSSEKNRDKIKSYIIMGKAVPEGYTTYVLRRNVENNHVEIWNALKGEAVFFDKKKNTKKLCGVLPIAYGFNIDHESDPTCQLREVGCIIGEDNIWANVQKHSHPALIEWDLDNKRHWKPFLTKKSRAKLIQDEGEEFSVQTEDLIYTEEARDNLTHQEDDIRTFISQKFADERVNHYTRWNHACNERLHKYIPIFEKFKRETCAPPVSTLRDDFECEERTQINIYREFNNLTSEINEVIRAKKPYGFPINVTFVSHDQLWEEVRSTGLHNIQNDNAEFVLSVGIYPYPNNINSVWIYLAALT